MLTNSSVALLKEIEKEWKQRCFSFKTEEAYKKACIDIVSQLYHLQDRRRPILLFFESPVACLYATAIITEARITKIPFEKILTNNTDLLWDHPIFKIAGNIRTDFLSSVNKKKISHDVLTQFNDKFTLAYCSLRLKQAIEKKDELLPSDESEHKNFTHNLFAHHLEAITRKITIYDFENYLQENLQNNTEDIMVDGLFKSDFASSLISPTFYNKFILCDLLTRLGLIEDIVIQKTINLFLKGVFDIYADDDFCFIVKLPHEINRDYTGKLHQQNGPAIVFHDDFKIFALYGNQIRERIWEDITEGNITRQHFLENNIEIQAAIYSLLGEEKMMKLFGAMEIDQRNLFRKDGEEEIVTLYKTNPAFIFMENQPLAWLKITCMLSGKDHVIRVEPNHTNAFEALVSLSPFNEDEYWLGDRI